MPLTFAPKFFIVKVCCCLVAPQLSLTIHPTTHRAPVGGPVALLKAILYISYISYSNITMSPFSTIPNPILFSILETLFRSSFLNNKPFIRLVDVLQL